MSFDKFNNPMPSVAHTCDMITLSLPYIVPNIFETRDRESGTEPQHLTSYNLHCNFLCTSRSLLAEDIFASGTRYTRYIMYKQSGLPVGIERGLASDLGPGMRGKRRLSIESAEDNRSPFKRVRVHIIGGSCEAYT